MLLTALYLFAVQVLVRGSEGVGVALAAVARARSTLRKLYQQDCVVYVAWKSAPPAAGAADTGAVAAAAAGAAPPGRSTSNSSSSTASPSQASQQQQQPLPQSMLLLPPMPRPAGPAHVSTPGTFASQEDRQHGQQQGHQQGGQHASPAAAKPADAPLLPRKLYKLVVMACDMDDAMAGWKHLSPHRRGSEQQQRWLVQARAQMQQRQRQRQQQTRAKRLRWFRPRSSPQQPPS